MPFGLVELAFRSPSITNALSPAIVVRPSLSHFGVRWLGTMASATKGLPPAATYKLAREIKVLPVPHSATTAAERARGQAWGLKTIESFHTHGTPPV